MRSPVVQRSNMLIKKLMEYRTRAWKCLIPSIKHQINQEYIEIEISKRIDTYFEKIKTLSKNQNALLFNMLRSEFNSYLMRSRENIRKGDAKLWQENLQAFEDAICVTEEQCMKELSACLERIQRFSQPELITRIEDLAMQRMEIYLGSLIKSVHYFKSIEKELFPLKTEEVVLWSKQV